MSEIRIKNLRKEKIKEDWDYKICRNISKLGNPYYMKDESERDMVCLKYQKWFYKNLDSLLPELYNLVAIYKRYGQLNLFCWCAPKRCHAETIKEWLENNGCK